MLVTAVTAPAYVSGRRARIRMLPDRITHITARMRAAPGVKADHAG